MGALQTCCSSRWPPKLRFLISPGSKKKEPRYACLREARASHSHRMWAEVSSPASHLTGLLEVQRVPGGWGGRFRENGHIKVVKLSALSNGHLYPMKYSWYSFLLETELMAGQLVAGRIMSINNSKNIIGNWTRFLPAGSAEPETTASPRASFPRLNTCRKYIDFRVVEI